MYSNPFAKKNKRAMIDTRFETTIDLRGEIENYRQVALIKYYKILLELDPRRDRLTMLAVIRCIDKLV